jgi:orotate phosphoribosyltransferase
MTSAKIAYLCKDNAKIPIMTGQVDRLLARSLMDLGAVLLRPSAPFTWASGWHSPIYCDNRRILSSPEVRSFVAQALADEAARLYPEAEVVAGVATGAIAHGVLAADRLGKPFVYVRPKPKDHGTGSQIEGVLEPGRKVVVIEDLISTGMSSLAAVDALRKAGADVLGMVAIFTYGFDVAREAFEKAGVRLTTLSCYSVLAEEARDRGYIDQEGFKTLQAWRESPSTWNK